MGSHPNRDWLKEYSEFLATEPTTVPTSLTRQVHNEIKKRLSPSPLMVFSKILGLHFITGFFSLAICTQFGLNPFKTSHSLSDIFMNWGGHGFCMVACGVIFISLTVFLAGFLLTIEETKALRRTEFLQIFTLSLISIGLFMALGAEVAFTFGGLWVLGGFIGGFAATEILWQLKR